jgi:hypothetical protein
MLGDDEVGVGLPCPTPERTAGDCSCLAVRYPNQTLMYMGTKFLERESVFDGAEPGEMKWGV